MFKRGVFKDLYQRVDALVTGRGRIDEDLFDSFEETLLAADLSMPTVDLLLTELRQLTKDERLPDSEAVRARLTSVLMERLGDSNSNRLMVAPIPPSLYLMVGVNGVGKTTTLGKLAYREQKERGRKVVLAAGDTFRAAAADQLQIWAERAGCDFIRQHERSDPAAVVFDAIAAAKYRQAELILVDTAGRLHNKKNLMEELSKISRVSQRELGRKPDEVLLALDATTGQNAVAQAREFASAAGVTGIALAKLDGTARGGIVVTIRESLGIPIKLVGVGEKPGDLRDFDSEQFVTDLLAAE